MLQVVQHLLPLPFLRVGRLQAIDPSTRGSCRERWQTHVFVLDHQAFQSANTVQRHHYQVHAYKGLYSMRGHYSWLICQAAYWLPEQV